MEKLDLRALEQERCFAIGRAPAGWRPLHPLIDRRLPATLSDADPKQIPHNQTMNHRPS
jgi:hypothetical protein